MRQHTNQEQTDKLLELGFPCPSTHDKDFFKVFTIGGLMEILEGDNFVQVRRTPTRHGYAVICFHKPSKKTFRGVKYRELIDALYAMILQLKEEELI